MKPPQKPPHQLGGLRTSSPGRGGKPGAVKTGGPKSGGARACHRARPASKDLGPSQRQLRAGELVRHALAEILRVEDVADPALAGVSVTVTEVRMSPDLKHAICFVEPLGAGLTGTAVDLKLAKDKSAEVVAGLNRATRYFRGILGKSIELKFTPQLRFLHDESFDAASHMNELFARPDVARDLYRPFVPPADEDDA